MKEKLESWESEFWSYINAGDGKRCPFSDSCLLDKKVVECFGNEKERENTRKIHDFVDIENDFSLDEINDLNFSACVKQGLIFQLGLKLVQKFLKRSWDNSLPVPDNLIFSDYEDVPIEVRYISLKANHGAVWRLKDGWLIHLNSNDTSARQRFTRYHETFHILAHSQGSPVFKKTRDTEVYYNEIVADHFAANILMPHEMVVKKWKETKNISELARIFNVPKPIAWGTLRMKRLM